MDSANGQKGKCSLLRVEHPGDVESPSHDRGESKEAVVKIVAAP